MAHGDKKWITDYRGKVKRSNNRTKLDYYGDLKWWDDMPMRMLRWHFGSNLKAVKFCPQCKHVRKHIEAESAEHTAIEDQIRREYVTKYGNITDANRKKPYQWCSESDEAFMFRTDFNPSTVYFDVFRDQHPDNKYVRRWWTHHWRSYVCFKCERKMDAKDEMWDRMPGMKAHYRDEVKAARVKYRSLIRHHMNRAKYDPELYDDIPIVKRQWLD